MRILITNLLELCVLTYWLTQPWHTLKNDLNSWTGNGSNSIQIISIELVNAENLLSLQFALFCFLEIQLIHPNDINPIKLQLGY